MAKTKPTTERRKAKKEAEFHSIRYTQYLRAATILVEKVLRYDPTESYTIDQIAANGMIRKRYIKLAIHQHEHIRAVPNKKKTDAAYQWTGPPLNHNFRGRPPVRTDSRV
jgi:hypothetical protein